MYKAHRPSPEYSCGKRNPLYPVRATSLVSIARIGYNGFLFPHEYSGEATGFFFRISTQVKAETRYIQYGQLLLYFYKLKTREHTSIYSTIDLH
jgi:hypothetical protein